MTKGRIGVICIVGSIALILDQILRFDTWEWNQLPTLWHHEGIAVAGLVIGAILLVMSRRAGQKG